MNDVSKWHFKLWHNGGILSSFIRIFNAADEFFTEFCGQGDNVLAVGDVQMDQTD